MEKNVAKVIVSGTSLVFYVDDWNPVSQSVAVLLLVLFLV